MCDLIDLNSPDVKGLVKSLPLIPVPENIESNEQACSLMMEKRESLGSNPFDHVLHETAEYVRNKGDPFEIMLQRALKYKNNKDTELKAQLVTFKDDFTPKRRKKFLKMMNKTLDESLIEDKFSLINEEKKETVSLVRSNTYICDNNTEKDSSFKEFVLSKSLTYKPCFNLQRSLSQENTKSPTKLQGLDKRSLSIADTLRIASPSNSTVSCLNKGFLESKQSQQSVFSNLSDVSSMTRSNSISLISNISPISPYNIVDHVFLGNDSVKMSNEKINTAENSTEIKAIQYNLSDLTKTYTLNYAINNTISAINLKEKTSQSNSMKEKVDKQTIDSKLIDVDIFIPEQDFNKEHNDSTNSISSSDSVFDKVDMIIQNEAKELSRIFEELTEKTDSISSTNNLLSNDTLWMSELLPAFEDVSVDNLIELPVSPKKNIKDNKSDDLQKQSPIHTDDVEENFVKQIEPQFIDNVPTVRQTMVTTLLSDLKKLVKAENNSQASKLIDNLESVLGIKYNNNTELLASLNVSNELQDPEISNNKLNNIEQSDKTSMCINKNQEENRKVSSEEKVCNNENSLYINYISEDTTQVTAVGNNNLLAKSLPCSNNEDSVNTMISSKIALNNSLINEKDSHTDEQLAIELLVNLGKLLSGQAEDAIILQLLKSIGKALNIASNNCKSEEGVQMDGKPCGTEPIMVLKTSKSEHNVHLVGVTEATQKQNFNFKSKPEKANRGSTSAIHSSDANTLDTQVKAKRKNISGLKDQKRSLSKAGLINIIANKKIPFPGVSRDATELNGKNEKPLAIINVKNKLKKKTDIISKRGPMKAMHSVGNIQKKGNIISLGRQTASSSQVITPPKSNTATSFSSKIISSTPNSTASPTPNDQLDGTSKTQLKSTDKKRNFSCDISPVSTRKEKSSERSIQPPPAKICTPKRERADSSGIPKYRTPPRKLNASFDLSSYQRQTPQYINSSLTNYQRYSPIRPKSAEKRPQTSFKENAEFLAKVKPFKLISKLQKNSTNDFIEKENCLE